MLEGWPTTTFELWTAGAVVWLVVVFFWNRNVRRKVREDPNLLWKRAGFTELQRREFELWDSAGVTFQRAEDERIHHPTEIKMGHQSVYVEVKWLVAETTQVRFRDADGVTMGEAVGRIDFLRRHQFTLTWRNDVIVVPHKGAITKGDQLLGRKGSFGLDGAFWAFRHDVPLDLRAAIVTLASIEIAPEAY